MAHIPPIVRRVGGFQSYNAGQDVVVKLSSLPKAIDGRPLHVADIELEATFVYDTAGGGSATEVPGYLQLAAFTNVRMFTGSHHWVDHLDGDQVQTLAEYRYGGAPIDRPQAAIDNSGVATTDNTLTATLRIQCVPLTAYSGGEADGAIPVGLLDEREEAGLIFTVAENFAGISGVTIKSMSALEVRVRLLPLDHLRGGLTDWKMTKRTVKDLDFTMRPHGRVQSLVIRDRFNQDGTVNQTPSQAGYANLQLTIGDFVIYSGRSVSEVAKYYNMGVPLGADLISTTAPEELPLYLATPGTKRTRMASGPIRLEIGTRNDANAATKNTSEVLLHETGRSNTQRQHDFALMLGAPPLAGDPSKASAQHNVRFANRDGRTVRHPVSDIIDTAVYWPGMASKGYKVPDRKLRRKLARL